MLKHAVLFVLPAALWVLCGASWTAWRATHGEIIKFGWELVPVVVVATAIGAGMCFGLGYFAASVRWRSTAMRPNSGTRSILCGLGFLGWWQLLDLAGPNEGRFLLGVVGSLVLSWVGGFVIFSREERSADDPQPGQDRGSL